MITPTPSSASSDRTLALVIGPTGCGKTTMAATSSAGAPPWLSAAVQAPPADASLTDLSDVAWLAFDRNALSGFLPLKVNVPLTYDLSGVAPNKIVEETMECIADLKKRSVPKVVFDTGTVFDVQLLLKHNGRIQADKRDGYAWVLNDWTRVYSALRQLDAELQILAHLKPAFDADDEARMRRLALNIPDYGPQITGQALGRIMADCDFILPVKRKVTMLQGKRTETLVVNTRQTSGVMAKVRGGTVLPDEVEADWRVIRTLMKGEK
jgi:hypothetical protein